MLLSAKNEDDDACDEESRVKANHEPKDSSGCLIVLDACEPGSWLWMIQSCIGAVRHIGPYDCRR